MNTPRSLTSLVCCLFLAGCGIQNTVRDGFVQATTPAAAVRARADVPMPPDLRIPADAVAAAPEIPIVPVPPVPLGSGVAPLPAPAPPSGAVVQASVAGPNLSAPPAAPATSAPTDSKEKTASLRQLQQDAAQWYAGVDSYIVRMTRREQVNGTAKPEEVMLFKFRKEPWSVHFIWVGKVGTGREVIYVKGQYENKIHTRLAAGDAPFMPAGHVMALDVDSVLVRNAGRHSITEAGIGASIDRFGALLDAQERGDHSHGVLTDLGMQNRPEFVQPVRGAQLVVAAGAEPELPDGGRRLYFFEGEHHLPMLVVTYDNHNQEVEYYRYDRLQAPVHLDAADFNPEKLWNNSKPAVKAK